jgi:hypothetical protein
MTTARIAVSAGPITNEKATAVAVADATETASVYASTPRRELRGVTEPSRVKLIAQLRDTLARLKESPPIRPKVTAYKT